MVKIISMSLDEKLLEEVEKMKEELSFSGRSELIRSGLKLLVEDRKSRENIKGRVECIILVMHNKKAENDVTNIKHKFEDIIQTQIHNNLREGKCMEIFVLYGEAEKVKEFYTLLQTNRKIDNVKLMIA